MARERIKKVVQNILENRGKVSMSQAMRDVGFSPAYAKNPQQFTNTKTYKELIKQYLPDELITARHNELINSSEISHYIFPHLQKSGKGKDVKDQKLTNAEIKEIVESVPGCRLIYVKRDQFGAHAYFEKPDGKIRKDAIDMAYKLKGNYAPEQIELTKRKYQGLTNAELMAMQNKFKSFLQKK